MKLIKTTVTFTYYSLVEDDDEPSEAADFVNEAASDADLHQECDHEEVDCTKPVTLDGDWSINDLVYHSADRDGDITVKSVIEQAARND